MSLSLFSLTAPGQEFITILALTIFTGILAASMDSLRLSVFFSFLIVSAYVVLQADLALAALGFSLLLLFADLVHISKQYSRVVRLVVGGAEENVSSHLAEALGFTLGSLARLAAVVAAASASIPFVSLGISLVVGGPFSLSIYAVAGMTSLIAMLLLARRR